MRFPDDGLDDGTVRLRRPTERDVKKMVEACQDPEIPRWTQVPSPYTPEDARKFIAHGDARVQSGSGIALVLAAPDSDELLGAIGSALYEFNTIRYCDLGYWLASWARGKGLGTRAVTLLGEWLFSELAPDYIEIVVSPDNEKSRRLAERCGYQRSGQTRRDFKGHVEDFHVYRLYAP